jgi:hypothetical protein
MSLKDKLPHKLHHPVWWEDVIPGALQAAPKLLARVLVMPAVGLHAVTSL